MSKRASRDELLLARVLHERQWAYARWLERLSWSQIRIAANQPEDRGGLGYDLSESALRGLVQQARADAGDLSMGRDERVERQQAELDEMARAIRAEMAETVTRTGVVPLKLVEALLAIGKREAELHGLAVQQVAVDVTHRDAVTEELNAMLVRAGRKPIDAVP